MDHQDLMRSPSIGLGHGIIKVGGKNCSLMAHVGKDHNFRHHKALMSWSEFLNQPSHIPNRFDNFKTQEILDNRFCLKTYIEVARWLAYQSCAFRGHDESDTSKNLGNFIELLRYSASLNSDVAKVLDNAPRNSSYTLPKIQKQIVQISAMKVKKYIQEAPNEASCQELREKALVFQKPLHIFEFHLLSSLRRPPSMSPS
ncbi:hypothetical protein QQ045_028197 [Rhodiola kirilowii]